MGTGTPVEVQEMFTDPLSLIITILVLTLVVVLTMIIMAIMYKTSKLNQ